jgi:hypothetical protein
LNYPSIADAIENYVKSLDEVPHHFHMHFVHAAEIIGYKHPDKEIRGFWDMFYNRMVNDLHLHPESEEEMDSRLGDNEEKWKASEGKLDPKKRYQNTIMDEHEDE